MTPQSELDLRELLAKGRHSKLPWKVYTASNGSLLGVGMADARGITDAHGGLWGSGAEKLDNAALIVALRNGADELLDEVERLRGALEAIRDIDGPYCDNCHSNEIHQAYRLARAALHPKQERDDAG